MSTETGALLLTGGLLLTRNAKTTHGLIRGPSRYPVAGVVDHIFAGRDAGEVVDGKTLGIPIFATLQEALDRAAPRPRYCVVGIATQGGVLPQVIRRPLLEAARRGMTLVNGMHQLLADDPELARLVEAHGASILDIRQPRPVSDLRFWSGEVLKLKVPRVAVLGTDCALGKRTTTCLLTRACRERGLRTEMIYTGQTGWLQGIRHGCILDAIPNDFVSGELERAILDCARETSPDVIFLEGQSGLRNPTGPCGPEFILSGGARGVILQHAPGRRYFEGLEEMRYEIPPLHEEIELVRLLGGEVWAVALSHEGLDAPEARAVRRRLAEELKLPVVLPLIDGIDDAVEAICRHTAR